MDIEEYIEKIIENGKLEDMEELSDMLEETMEIVQQYDDECYKDLEMRLYKMAFGNNFNKEMAKEIVSKMQPYGERWSYEETRRIQEENGLTDIKSTDFFVVINSAYNDYKDIFAENMNDYIKFTLDFIRDEDAKEDKVFLYFTMIPR